MNRHFSAPSKSLAARHRFEITFRWFGGISIFLALGFLALMLAIIANMGAGALKQTRIALDVPLLQEDFDINYLDEADFDGHIKSALRLRFPDATSRSQKRQLNNLLSIEAPFTLKNYVLENPDVIGGISRLWFIASDDVDLFFKGSIELSPEGNAGRLPSEAVAWVNELKTAQAVRTVVNFTFFTGGDSREPELAGIFSALVGTALSLAICLTISFPIGVLSAIYLEEFVAKNRWSDFIEINITNLAAVPSIVFGILGLSIFINGFGLPRSSPLVGGMVLALMTLPTIIIASRAALRSVPVSIRHAAIGLGATPIQTIFHHVTPLAMPAMLTGAIIGMARALGETAPLLMIGMVAFIVDVPDSILSPATALPVQIFLWADSSERAFLEKASAAIIVLVVFLIIMNLSAIVLRQKFQKKF